MNQTPEPEEVWDPDRVWHPDDPNRSCATCGSRPTGKYRDGSPQYSCGPHPTLVATAEETERYAEVRDRWKPKPRGNGR